MNCDFVHDGLKYAIIKGNEVVIVGYNSMPSVLNIAPSFVEDEVEYVVVEIAARAFQGCMGLTSIVVSKSITKIGVEAFKGCKGLTTITLPDSIINIGEEAFKDCESLTKTIYEGDIQSWCKIQFGDGDSNPTKLSRTLYIDNKLLTDLVIPNGVTHIGAFQFAGLSRLATVTIPDTVVGIGKCAFSSCKGLQKTIYEGSIESWCKIQFNYYWNEFSGNLYINNTLLTDLVIPDGVTSIREWAFFGCTSLTSVTIPNSVTSVGESAFYKCTSLTSVTIPNSVTSIGEGAFSSCASLTSVTIPNSVTSIGDWAFGTCASLTSVTIPNSVTSIGDWAFFGCTNLTSVTIPNSVTSIGESAFDSCTNLSIYIPFSVKEIGKDAFKDCKEVSCSVLFEISENKGKLVFLVIVLAIVFSIMFLLGI